jgi:hypothetical protein
MRVNRGDVVLVDYPFTTGGAKVLPALVVQNDRDNARYQPLSDRGFVIYPGRLTQLSTFRTGNIGWLFPSDLEQLVLAVRET